MRSKILLFLTALVLSCFVFGSCGSEQTSSDQSGANTADTLANAAQPPAEVKLTDFSNSPEFPDATIAMEYKNGMFSYQIGGSNYKLGEQTPDAPQKMCANSAEGQHIHLIVDNEPYIAKYTPKFEHEIADGEHYILSFLSRSYHESIKTEKAHTAVKAEVKNNSFAKTARSEEHTSELQSH